MLISRYRRFLGKLERGIKGQALHLPDGVFNRKQLARDFRRQLPKRAASEISEMRKQFWILGIQGLAAFPLALFAAETMPVLLAIVSTFLVFFGSRFLANAAIALQSKNDRTRKVFLDDRAYGHLMKAREFQKRSGWINSVCAWFHDFQCRSCFNTARSIELPEDLRLPGFNRQIPVVRDLCLKTVAAYLKLRDTAVATDEGRQILRSTERTLFMANYGPDLGMMMPESRLRNCIRRLEGLSSS